MNEYQRRVLEGRKEFLRLVQKQERELLEIYEEASKQISYKLSRAKAGSLTSRYLTELDKSIDRYVLELRTNLSKSMKEGIEASSQIASAVQLRYFDTIVSTQELESAFTNMFTKLPSNIVKQLISGNYYEDGKTLDKRIWNITKKNSRDIDTLIKINVAKGTNARELAKELDAYINPYKRIEAKTLETGMSKNISYQAQRLSRTCLTHASTETYIQGSKMNPFCEGLKWNLSPSHSSRMHGKTDICDTYAGKIFKLDEVPIQHPNCLCYFTQEVMDIDKARDELIAWLNGEGNPKLDKWLEDYGEEFGINKTNYNTGSKKESKKIVTNKNGKEIKFDLGNMKEDKQSKITSVLTNLSFKYDTLVEKVLKGNSSTGTCFNDANNTIYLFDSKISSAVHEFAHSIAVTTNDKYGITNNKEFWKEIKKVRNEYEKECRENPTVSISAYSHSKSKTGSMLDEFMAESFAHATLKHTGDLEKYQYGTDFKYSDKVLKIVDKYFKKK